MKHRGLLIRRVIPCGTYLVCLLTAMTVSAERIEWIRQFNEGDYDVSEDVSVDGNGNVYVAGFTYGGIGDDAKLHKFDSAGNLLWTQEIATNAIDEGTAVSADGLGSVYLAGITESLAPLGDAFISRFDEAGNLLWKRQFGTANRRDWAYGVSADRLGHAYLSGRTDSNLDGINANGSATDAFLTKYDDAGNLLWTRQLGAAAIDLTYSYDVSADSLGSVYISGTTRGSLDGTSAGSNDAFVAKYDDAGNLLWTRQFGTSGVDEAWSVSVDGLGNIFCSGFTAGSLVGTSAGNRDAFLAKFDSSGNQLWMRQFGTSADDLSYGVSADGLGDVYISGHTTGDLVGTSAGSSDIFAGKFDQDGNVIWMRQFGTDKTDDNFGVASDGLGNVYISGDTNGNLGGPAISYDAFLVKISDAPEPDSLAAILCGAGLLGIWRRRKNKQA